MRTRPCCWVCYDKSRPRTKLGAKPPSLSGRIRDGRHGPGPGPGPGAEIQLHGHNWQRYPDNGISEASRLPAKPRRMRLLSGHDQLVSPGIRRACCGVIVRRLTPCGSLASFRPGKSSLITEEDIVRIAILHCDDGVYVFFVMFTWVRWQLTTL